MSQFVLMKFVLVKYSGQSTSRKPALHNPAFYFHRDFMFSVLRVEMCRRMVPVVHPNNDPKEAADFGHCLNESLRERRAPITRLRYKGL